MRTPTVTLLSLLLTSATLLAQRGTTERPDFPVIQVDPNSQPPAAQRQNGPERNPDGLNQNRQQDVARDPDAGRPNINDRSRWQNSQPSQNRNNQPQTNDWRGRDGRDRDQNWQRRESRDQDRYGYNDNRNNGRWNDDRNDRWNNGNAWGRDRNRNEWRERDRWDRDGDGWRSNGRGSVWYSGPRNAGPGWGGPAWNGRSYFGNRYAPFRGALPDYGYDFYHHRYWQGGWQNDLGLSWRQQRDIAQIDAYYNQYYVDPRFPQAFEQLERQRFADILSVLSPFQRDRLWSRMYGPGLSWGQFGRW